MPVQCLIGFCKNRGGMAGVHFFRLTQNRYKEWLQAIGRNLDKRLSPSNTICSDHFLAEDFYLGNNNKVYIREGAVPSLRLRSSDHLKKTPRRSVYVRSTEDGFGFIDIFRLPPSIPVLPVQDDFWTSSELATTSTKSPRPKKLLKFAGNPSTSAKRQTECGVSSVPPLKPIKLDHNYSRSPGSYLKQLSKEKERARIYKNKFIIAEQLGLRRKKKIESLKAIINNLKFKCKTIQNDRKNSTSCIKCKPQKKRPNY